MDFDKNRREGEIFPELRHGESEPTQEPYAQATDRQTRPPADWREEPLEPMREPQVREVPRRIVVRESRGGSTGVLWLALTFLLVVLAGASFYGYRTLQEANIRLNQIPTMLRSMATVDGRLDNVESQLSAWSRNWQGLSGRMGKLEKRVGANYRSARRHAEVLTAQLGKQIQDQMEARNRVVDTHLDQLDSAQRSAQAHIADLNRELSEARQEIAALRQDTNGDLALLHEHVAGNEERTNKLAQQVEHERVNFEVAKNRITEVSPEISIDLTKLDTQYQRFSGWVYFEPDRRYLWVRDQGVMQPVVFYDQQQSRQYQVVVTRIRGGALAAGYLLVPATSGALAPGAAAGAATGK